MRVKGAYVHTDPHTCTWCSGCLEQCLACTGVSDKMTMFFEHGYVISSLYSTQDLPQCSIHGGCSIKVYWGSGWVWMGWMVRHMTSSFPSWSCICFIDKTSLAWLWQNQRLNNWRELTQAKLHRIIIADIYQVLTMWWAQVKYFMINLLNPSKSLMR